MVLLYIVSLPFLLIKSKKQFYLIIFPLVTLFILFLITDLGIYKIFKFHINGVIINFFTTPGAWDSIDLGYGTIATIVLLILVVIIFEFLILKKIVNKNIYRPYYYKRKGKFGKIIFLLIILLAADKLVFAVADIYNQTQITKLVKLFPLYQPFTMKHFAEKTLGIKINRENKLDINIKSTMLKYPLSELHTPENSKKPNIIWIILDAYRYDMLNNDVTPNINAFSHKSQTFKNHYSGGIATRFGIFSLFYGVYSYNWHKFLAERVSPVFIDELIKLGYDFNISSSTKLTYPEFRKTAFVKIPDAIYDNYKGNNSFERDRNQINEVKKWLLKREKNKPFFSFIFLDSAHSRIYPPAFEKFKTNSKSTNYLLVTDKGIKESKLNYMNALWYLDHLVKEIFDTLVENKMFDNTVVLITGDHGEEFGEHGFFGHNSAFTIEQTKVPMIIYVPWIKEKTYENMTSHLDIPATMLHLLGYKDSPGIYSDGFSMIDNASKRNFNIACGWNNCSYFSGDYYVNFSMETYNTGFFEIRDRDYREIPYDKEKMANLYQNLMKVIKDFNKFSQ
jgi:membrane-anchored protein YejM (alkaline phosphatase superfamily)